MGVSLTHADHDAVVANEVVFLLSELELWRIEDGVLYLVEGNLGRLVLLVEVMLMLMLSSRSNKIHFSLNLLFLDDIQRLIISFKSLNTVFFFNLILLAL
jgi:hypothetical protein